MTMAVTYGTFAGQTVHEERGGVERIYVADTLGSTVILADVAGNVTDTFQYWSYGEEHVRTGTTPTPFRFLGTIGYYRDASERLYVRARSYIVGTGRWMTVDPIWPLEPAYTYARSRPITRTDPTGLGGGDLTWPDPSITIPPWVLEIIKGLLGALGIFLSDVLAAVLAALASTEALIILLAALIIVAIAYSCEIAEQVKREYNGKCRKCKCACGKPTAKQCADYEYEFLCYMTLLAARIFIAARCPILQIPDPNHAAQIAGNGRSALGCLCCAAKCSWVGEHQLGPALSVCGSIA